MPYRFTGHETFPCRYAWLPKAYRVISCDQAGFADEDQAMAELGVGKNMFRALRFWMQVMGVAKSTESPKQTHFTITPNFGTPIFQQSNGLDPFLEDIRTLWLLHWNIATLQDDPLFAWDYMLFHWHRPEFSHTEAVRLFQKEADKQERKLSQVTLSQHFEVFLHTYVPTRGKKGDVVEDNLDSPLVELDLIHKIGERPLEGTSKREAIYAFRREEKPDVTPSLFAYCLNEFWENCHPNEQTLSFRSIVFDPKSPGQVFKLSERDVRTRLEELANHREIFFRYKQTAVLHQIERMVNPEPAELLRQIYQ